MHIFFLAAISIVMAFFSISILLNPSRIASLIRGAKGFLYTVGFIELIFSSFLLAMLLSAGREGGALVAAITLLFGVTLVESMIYLTTSSVALEKYKKFISRKGVLRLAALVQLGVGAIVLMLVFTT